MNSQLSRGICHMATLSWITGTSGLWTTAANWSSDAVPGAGDTAVVNAPGSYLVSVPGTVSVGNAILDDTGAGISVGGSLSVAGDVTVTAGALDVSGGLDAASLSNAGTVGNSGILDIGALSNTGFIGNGDFLSVATLSNTGSIDNTGTLELTGTVLTLAGTIADSGAVIVSGSVTGASLAQIGGAGVLSITGTVDNAGATLGGNDLHVQSAGLIQGGTIAGIVLNDGATIDGVTASGTVQVNGSLTILDDLIGPAGGTGTLLFVNGATLAFANAETLDNVELAGAGAINTDSTLTVGSHALITADHFNTASELGFEGAGTVISTGTVVALSAVSINAHGNAAVVIGNADFENFGVLAATDVSANNGSSPFGEEGFAELDITGAIFVNEVGGLIETGQSFGGGLVVVSGATSFTNDGTLSTMGPGATQGGTIDIEGFVQGSGTIEINGGGAVTLTFANHTQTVDFLDGGGTLTFSSANGAGAAIEGFKDGDAIVLDGVSATPISFTSGDLRVQTIFGPLNLDVTGSYSVDDFVATYNGTDTVIQLGASQTSTWISGTSGLWTTAADWSSDQVPGPSSAALIGVPGTYTVTAPGTITVFGLTVDNAAADVSTGGTFTVQRTLYNTGTVDNTGILNVGNLDNLGTIDNAGTLILSGTSSSISTVIDNVGGTLINTGSAFLTGGLIQGGTLADMNLLSGSTLDGVAVLGSLTTNGNVTITDSLIAVGTPLFNFANGSVEFAGDQSLAGITMVGGGTIIADGILTIGTNTSITERINSLNQSNTPVTFEGLGTIVNDGSIVAISNDSESHTNPFPPITTDTTDGSASITIANNDFENFGVINATDTSEPPETGTLFNIVPGRDDLDITSVTFVNHAGGVIEVGQGSGTSKLTIAATVDFINDGTLSTWDPATSAGGTIDIAGFAQGSGTIEIGGAGSVTLESGISNTQTIDFVGAGTLWLDQPASVPAVIEGFNATDVMILNGVSATPISYTSGDLKLQTAASGTIDLGVVGGYSLADFVASSVGMGTEITLTPAQTLTWIAGTSGVWTTASDWSSDIVPAVDDTAVVGVPGTYTVAAPGTITVFGLAVDNAAADVSTSGTFIARNFLTNTGTIDNTGVLNAASLDNLGTIDNTGTLVLTGGGTANSAVIDNAGGTLINTGSVVLSGGLIQGGTLVNINLGSGSTLDGVTVLGSLATSGNVTILDGLTGVFSFIGGSLAFTGDQSLAGITLASAGSIVTDGTLTVGNGVKISELVPPSPYANVIPLVFGGAGTIFNHGSVFANSSDSTTSFGNHFLISNGSASLIVAGTDFENFGLIDASDLSLPEHFSDVSGLEYFTSPGFLDITAATFVNHAGGVIETGDDNGTAEILVAGTTDFINNGTVTTNSHDAIPVDSDATPANSEPGAVSETGGVIDIAAAVTGSGTIVVDDGMVTVEGAVAGTQTIAFAGVAGTLVVDEPASMQAVIVGFNPVGEIDLNGVSATAISYTGGDLKLQTSTGTLDLGITGNHVLSDFLVNNSGTETVIQLAPAENFTWIAGTSGVWTTAAEWSSNEVPGAADVAVIGVPGTYTVTAPGTITVFGVAVDNAVAEVSTSGVFTVLNILSNAGTIDNSGTLSAAGLDNLGTINNTGTLVLSGTGSSNSTLLDNAGGTLINTGSVFLSGGSIQGGTLVNVDLLSGSTLDGVTVLGSLASSGNVTILDGLTAVGTPLLNFSQGSLEFAGDQSLAGITLVGGGSIVADNILTIGNGVTIREAIGAITAVQGQGFEPLVFGGVGTIVNHGSIFANAIDSIVFNNTVPLFDRTFSDGNASLSISADFENFGVIDASDLSGSHFNSIPEVMTPSNGTLDITAATFVNEAEGIIETGRNYGTAEISIAGTTDFINDGTVTTNSHDTTLLDTETGGAIDIAAAVTGSGTIVLDNGNVTVEGAVAGTQTIAFAGFTGTLTVDQPASMHAVIVGFNPVGGIILNGVSATAISYTSGDLKLQTSTGTLDLGITGAHSLSDFRIVAGPDVTAIDATLPCLAAGTHVATDHGSVLVEQLQVGDIVVTGDGQLQAIQWIGHRGTDCRRHPNPDSVRPIRIAAHAFGHGLPRRALLLSPDHAVFVDDMLVPIKLLVNGTTIVQRKVARVTYYHVELPRHDVLLAEGLPVESYLETGGRAAFVNGGEVMQLHPNFVPDPVHVALIWDSEGYAPLVVAPTQLAPIRDRLQRQAEALEVARKGRRRASKAA
jgi:hypothetical protein